MKLVKKGKKFAKAASILNTPEYTALIQIRRENPDFTIELREIKKKEGKKSYRNLTYDKLGTYAAVAREIKRSPDSVAKYIKKSKQHDNIAIALASSVRKNAV